MVSGILERVAKGKIEDALDFIYDWYIDRAQQYLALQKDAADKAEAE